MSEQMKVRKKKKKKEGGRVGLGLVWLFARSNSKYMLSISNKMWIKLVEISNIS